MADTGQDFNDKSLNFASLMVNPTLRNAVRSMAKKWNPSSPLARKVKDFYVELPRSNHVPTDMELDLYLKSKNFDESTISLALLLKNKIESTVEEYGVDSLISSFFSRCRRDMIKDIQKQFAGEQQEDESEALANYVERISNLNNMGSKRLTVVNFNEIDMEKFYHERIDAPKRLIKSQFNMVNEASNNGAYEKGWLVQVVAPTNVGKTWFLLNEAIHFAENGLKVFWITLGDMDDRSILERVISIVTQANPKEITSHFLTLVNDPQVRQVLANMDFIFVHANELTSSDVVNSVLNHEIDGTSYDVVIVDYDDNFKHLKESMFLEGGNAYNDLVRLAQNGMGTANPDFKLVFVASQAKPEFWKQEEMTLDCVACSSEKQKKAVMTIGIGCNQIVNNIGTMSILKHRYGTKGRAKYVREPYGRFYGIDKRDYDNIVSRHAYSDSPISGDSSIRTNILTVSE